MPRVKKLTAKRTTRRSCQRESESTDLPLCASQRITRANAKKNVEEVNLFSMGIDQVKKNFKVKKNVIVENEKKNRTKRRSSKPMRKRRPKIKRNKIIISDDSGSEPETSTKMNPEPSSKLNLESESKSEDGSAMMLKSLKSSSFNKTSEDAQSEFSKSESCSNYSDESMTSTPTPAPSTPPNCSQGQDDPLMTATPPISPQIMFKNTSNAPSTTSSPQFHLKRHRPTTLPLFRPKYAENPMMLFFQWNCY
ncbi:unnamed protein product [Moneuplotes crassus]|uniref:Uncharacterized protein n=1 Tax=Euplotes crassus TaxID=5936 RepID=A0AAD2D0E0_EUPCR|nr:unnamed protein product [Moneuplotes crassus]